MYTVQAQERADRPGLVAMLQTVLQLFCAIRFSRQSYATKRELNHLEGLGVLSCIRSVRQFGLVKRIMNRHFCDLVLSLAHSQTPSLPPYLCVFMRACASVFVPESVCMCVSVRACVCVCVCVSVCVPACVRVCVIPSRWICRRVRAIVGGTVER